MSSTASASEGMSSVALAQEDRVMPSVPASAFLTGDLASPHRFPRNVRVGPCVSVSVRVFAVVSRHAIGSRVPARPHLSRLRFGSRVQPIGPIGPISPIVRGQVRVPLRKE